MAGTRVSRAENQPSRLLNEEENHKLFELLGQRCVTLSSAVVQVFWAERPSYNRWNKRWCGVATFVKDNNKRSYYIRIFDLKNEKLLWEQELYSDFQYKDPRPYFHTFECDDCPAALNFANEEEANSFRNAVNDKIQIRQRRKETRKRTGGTSVVGNVSSDRAPSSQSMQSMHTMSTVAPLQMNTLPANAGPSTGTTNKKNKKGKKKTLTKSDIGAPTNFQHISHVGWSAETGFDLEGNPELRELFSQVGITESQLKEDKEMSKFVMDFLDKRGGIDAVKREREQRPLPPPPSVPSQPPPSLPPGPPLGGHATSSSRPPPPAVPPPIHGTSSRPPPLPITRPSGPSGRTAPPPPPPNPPPSNRGLPPPPPPIGPPAIRPTQPSAVTAAPPPPGPPPPPPPGPPPPLAPSTEVSIPPVGSHPIPAAEPPDGRSALLSDIQKGTQLRPVSEDRPIAKSTSSEDEGLAGALAKALAARAGALKINDSDSEESSEDDEEWDE